MEKKILGIRELEKKYKTIDHSQIQKIFEYLTNSFPLPQIIHDNPKNIQYGHSLIMRLDGFPMPKINLYDGRLVYEESEYKNNPIYASFRGFNEPIISRAEYNPKNNILKVKVPQNSLDGLIILHFPVEKIYGPSTSKSEDNEIIHRVNDCTSPQDFITENINIHYFPVIFGYFSFVCNLCLQEGYICPHGAIGIDDDGNCFVNQDICIGQYNIPGDYDEENDFYPRGPEISCWNCFEDNERFSLKCPKRKIGKVLYISYACCGCCREARQILPGFRLPNLCIFGAIYGGNPICHENAGPNQPQAYAIDQMKCTGCMTCYKNITCPSLKMVAYIKKRCLGRIYLLKIMRKTIPIEVSHNSSRQTYALGLWYDSLDEPVFDKIYFTLNSQNEYHFQNQEISFIDSLHIALLSGDNSIRGSHIFPDFQYIALNYPVRTINCNDRCNLIPGSNSPQINCFNSLIFRCRFDVFELIYRMERIFS